MGILFIITDWVVQRPRWVVDGSDEDVASRSQAQAATDKDNRRHGEIESELQREEQWMMENHV